MKSITKTKAHDFLNNADKNSIEYEENIVNDIRKITIKCKISNMKKSFEQQILEELKKINERLNTVETKLKKHSEIFERNNLK